jgi:hypothetical protein
VVHGRKVWDKTYLLMVTAYRGRDYILEQTQSGMVVSPSADLIEEIGSGYPTNVYDGVRLLLPTLRQKMAQSRGMMLIDLPDGC